MLTSLTFTTWTDAICIPVVHLIISRLNAFVHDIFIKALSLSFPVRLFIELIILQRTSLSVYQEECPSLISSSDLCPAAMTMHHSQVDLHRLDFNDFLDCYMATEPHQMSASLHVCGVEKKKDNEKSTASLRVTGYQIAKSISWYAHLLDCPACNHPCKNHTLYNFAILLTLIRHCSRSLSTRATANYGKHWVPCCYRLFVVTYRPPTGKSDSSIRWVILVWCAMHISVVVVILRRCLFKLFIFLFQFSLLRHIDFLISRNV